MANYKATSALYGFSGMTHYSFPMRGVRLILVSALVLTSIPALSATTPKPGAICSKVGATQQVKNKKYTCVKSGSKKVWDKGVKVVQPIATVSPTPSPTPSPKPSPSLTATPTPTPTLKPTPTPTPTPEITPSPTPSVAGPADKCKLPVADFRGDVAIGGFPRINERLKSLGKVIVKVLFVDFPDAPATMTPQDAFAKVSDSANLFDELSYGRMQFTYEPNFKWYRMSLNTKKYAPLNQSFNHHKGYISEVMAMADPEVDFSQTDAFLIISNPDAKETGYSGPAFAATWGNGFTLDGRYIANGATSAYDLNNWKYIWANHEFGHTLGLPDLYAFNGEDKTNPMDFHRFVGEYSMMGLSSLNSNSPGLLAWERWLLGWLDDDQINCVSDKSATSLITPIQRKGGLKAMIVPLSQTKAVVVESRRAEGVDKNLSKPGALVYLVDSTIQSGMGPVKILPSDKSDNRRLQSTRARGESVTVEGITVTVKSSSTDGDTVEVTRN